MKNTAIENKLLNRDNALKIKEHYRTDVCKNGWFYILVLTNKNIEISFYNSIN